MISVTRFSQISGIHDESANPLTWGNRGLLCAPVEGVMGACVLSLTSSGIFELVEMRGLVYLRPKFLKRWCEPGVIRRGEHEKDRRSSKSLEDEETGVGWLIGIRRSDIRSGWNADCCTGSYCPATSDRTIVK